MARTRSFNKIWKVGRFMTQTMLSGFQSERWAVRLIPSITVAHNHRMVWAVGLDWLFGDFNFGWMQKDFAEGEGKRLEMIQKEAAKIGISPKQQAMRWDGYC